MSRRAIVSFLVLVAIVVGLGIKRESKPPVKPAEITSQSALTSHLITNQSSGLSRSLPADVPTDPKALAKFRAKAKQELMGVLREKGIYGSRDELKAAQDNGDLIWARINQPDSVLSSLQDSWLEPFQPRVLEALSHILKNSTDSNIKLRAATLLYRYDSTAGKDYLLSLVGQANPDQVTIKAALTLALNREAAAISGARELIPKIQGVTFDLLAALGKWGAPEIGELIQDMKRREPRNYGYDFALAQQNAVGARPALERALTRQPDIDYGSVRLEGVLARIGGYDIPTWYSHMEQLYARAPYQNAPSLLLSYDYAGAEVSSPHLLKLLRESISLHEAWLAGMAEHARLVQEGNSTAYAKLPKPSPTTLMSGAARLLADWNVKEAVPILNDLLPVVQKDGRIDPQLNFALGLALYRLDPVNWRDTLINIGMKQDHIDRIPDVAKLRPIAPDLIPKQSSLKWR